MIRRIAALLVAVLALAVPVLMPLPLLIGAALRCAWEEPQPCDPGPIVLADPAFWSLLVFGIGLAAAMLWAAWALWRTEGRG